MRKVWIAMAITGALVLTASCKSGKVKELEQQVTQLQDQVTTLQDSITKLNMVIDSLNNELAMAQTPEVKTQSVKKPASKPAKPAQPSKPAPPPKQGGR